MADTLDITAGAGTTIATDDVAGSHYQRIKLSDGTADATGVIAADIGVKANALRVVPANDITAATYIGNVVVTSGVVTTVSTVTTLSQLGGQAISMGEGVLAAGTQRVTLATDDDGVAHLATIAGDTTNIETAIQLLDNAVDGNYLNCNLNIAGTDCVGNAGVLAAGVLRVTIATDDECNNFLGTIDADTGNMVTALQLLDNAIDGNYLNVNLNVAGTDAAAGEGVISAQTQRVTIATDDDGVAHLATLAGAVAATHMQCDIVAGTVTTVSTVTSLSQLGGQAINLGEGVIATGTQRVTIATDDDGVAHLATIAGDTTAIETAIQIIDDWDATHAGAAVADGPQIMGAGYSTALPTDVGADADAARICTDRYGRILRGIMPQNFQATMTSADAQAATPVKVKTADRKMYILSLVVSTDTAMNIQFQDDTGPTVLIEQLYLAANGGAHLTWPAEAPLVVNTNEDFDVIASAAGNISVTITGYLAV